MNVSVTRTLVEQNTPAMEETSFMHESWEWNNLPYIRCRYILYKNMNPPVLLDKLFNTQLSRRVSHVNLLYSVCHSTNVP